MTSEFNQVGISGKISSYKDYLFKTYQVICYLRIYFVTIIIEHVRLILLLNSLILHSLAELYKVLESEGQEQQIPNSKNVFEYTAVMAIKGCIKITLCKVYILFNQFLTNVVFFFFFFDVSKYWNITLCVLNGSVTI